MRSIFPLRTRLIPGLFLAACLGLSAPSGALADSVTFLIKDLTFDGTAAQNNWPVPIHASEPGVDGHLVWTYPTGDFQAGSGVLQDLLLPITWFPLASAIITVDATGITGAQPGNTHDLTYDFQLQFAQPLTSPTQVSGINAGASTFDFTGQYQGFNGEWLGNVSGGMVIPATVAGLGGAPARPTALAPASPNPFRRATTISYDLARPGTVELAIHSVDGRRVALLERETQAAGSHQVRWDGRGAGGQALPSGIYFLRLSTPDRTLTRSVALLR